MPVVPFLRASAGQLRGGVKPSEPADRVDELWLTRRELRGHTQAGLGQGALGRQIDSRGSEHGRLEGVHRRVVQRSVHNRQRALEQRGSRREQLLSLLPCPTAP
eukprot:CAMPEP_0179976782 /NCGR_PEP_ID=MMETSP0983-20121128/39583_1 /TAXON_ID=483367 /ORGANISM="non described non described, Strain CCMP 2436" /LENGTH=103 /DNA_ID=CAMNT_0021893673 /DNA_START=334 /DNA_END=641 /DNA_ORIENTATION=-